VAEHVSIDANRIYVTEIVGCEWGVHLSGACTHNAIEVTSVHLAQTNIQLGDEGATPSQVRANRIAAHLESQGVADATGALVYGGDNNLTLSSEGMAKDRDIVFGRHAENDDCDVLVACAD
jgi:hypothetical protein